LATLNTDNLVSHYLLNDDLATTNVLDNFGSNNGTLVGGDNTEDLNVAGKINTALQLDGTSDYINCGNDGSLQLTQGTYSAWIKTSAYAGTPVGIVCKYQAFSIFHYAHLLQVYDHNTSSWINSGVTIDDDIWYLITVVFDSGVVNGTKLYVDGEYKAQGTITIVNQDNPVLIGAGYTGGQRFNGIIDDVRIYNRILTNPEILLIYNGGVGTEEEELSDDLILGDTLTLYDSIFLKLSKETLEDSDTLTLSDEIDISLLKNIEEQDTITLSDEIEVLFSKESIDTLTLSDDINVATIQLVRSDFYNKFGMVNRILSDIDNKIGFISRTLSDINNKIGFLKSWQVAGDAGFQSLGKTYIKVYIDSVEQTDVDVDSITITKSLNSPHTANFVLGKPYDNTKPDQESEVEIKYNTWTLYKGYITQITPTNSPDSIKIICQDQYWKRNKTKKYFFVGHRPTDNFELYYNYISTALSTYGASFDIGSFVPQTINLFGTGESDAISQLVDNSGNYAWYYDVDGSKNLWTAGKGNVINLERQQIGTNLGLYQVLSHSFRESIENIVNKFRVQMGDLVIRRFNNTGGVKEYAGYRYEHFYGSATPAWDDTYERLAQNSDDGNGVFFHSVSKNKLYKDVFTKYYLPSLDSDLESWTDRYPPKVSIHIPFGFWQCSLGYPVSVLEEEEGDLTEGFTIDYGIISPGIHPDSGGATLTFNEPIYLFQTNQYGEMTEIRRPEISLQLWKEKYYSNTENPSDDPTTDISNPLMFFTEKIGDYPETIMENYELTGLGIQIGGWYISGQTVDGDDIWTHVPSWNDTLFAKDYANWQLSKNCDKKINGSIDLTIDAIQFYNITLDKRIMIEGIIDSPLNIIAINYNIGSWKVSVQLENSRYYKRDVSFQSRGE